MSNILSFLEWWSLVYAFSWGVYRARWRHLALIWRKSAAEIFSLCIRTQKQREPQRIADFLIDRYPVTNADFLQFVQENPRWKRGVVASIFAGASYLSHWKSAASIPTESAKLNQPVSNVSWFAAKAYCQWKKKRLPKLNEWEYVAMASATQADGRASPGELAKILSWYSRPNPEVLPEVAQGPPNFWGVYDMHGLVWEWVADFNAALVTGESRADSDLERNLFCGTAAANASPEQLTNYAAFMRYSFRSSLQGSYAVSNLGFRCARDTK